MQSPSNGVTTSALDQLLRSIPLFKHLPDTQFTELLRLGKIETWEAGRIILQEGAVPENLYVILSGSVQLWRRNEDGSQLEIGSRAGGDLLGILGIVDGEPLWATATVAETCEVFLLDRQTFTSALSRFPQLLPGVLGSLSGKVRKAQEKFFMEALERQALDLATARERYRSVDQVLAATDKAKSTDTVLQIVVEQLCALTGWPVGHAYVLDEVSGELVCSPASHVSNPLKFEPLRRLTEATAKLTVRIGLPGQVFRSGKPAAFASLSECFDDPRRELAMELGLTAGFAFPVVLDDRVIAAIEFFADKYGPADEIFLETMTSFGKQLGRTIESKRYEEKLLHTSLFDTLTGLPNRALFTESLKRCLARVQRRGDYGFAVLFVDLDRFKIVNDSLGHSSGDLLLAEIARRISGCLRPTDVVARLGGDEYGILLDEVKHLRDATRAAERIRRKLQLPLNLNGREVYTSASIGIALSSTGYDSAEDLLRDADTAMYRAKAEGNGQYKVFDISMHEYAVGLLKLENDLRGAIDRDEFRLDYQPIVSLETGKILGLEALLRWHHPERGLVPPGEFIRVAEETDLVIPITRWILQQACSDLREWKNSLGPESPLTVSVNLSSKHLKSPELLEEVAAVLSRNKLGAQNLSLEITESQLMENPAALSDLLNRLSSLGIKIAIDDFGTGYSSLSYLSGFRVHALKIDRSFVAKLKIDERNTAIVRAIISLGRNLGLEVVAEGVETAAQLDYLRELKCGLGQGFFFFRPMDASAVAKLLARESAGETVHKIKVSRLRSFDLFQGIQENALAEIAANCRELEVPGGTVLIEQGQASSDIFLLEQGSVGIHRRESGISQFLGVMEAPAFFGEGEVLNPGRVWNARVKALSDLRLLALPVSYCASFLERSELLRENLEQLIAERSPSSSYDGFVPA